MKYIVILTLLFFWTGCSNKNPEKTGLEGKLMPSFNLLLLDSTTRLNTNSIPAGKPIVLIFVSPYCPYCQAQTEEIVKDIKSFSDIRLYILTTFPLQSLRQFSDRYSLNRYTNITVGQNDDTYFVNAFKVKSIPYIAIYSKDRRLKRVFAGKVSTDLIKDVARE